MPSTTSPARDATSRPVLAAIECHAGAGGASRAISDASRSCTYTELGVLIDKWAGALASAGAQRGSLVGIAMERSMASLVGMLSVVRTGAAYVPLDLTAPQERNAAIVHESGLSLLLADGPSPTIDTLAPRAVITVAELDACATAFREPHEPEPDDPFYVAYTSGSTGKPRGVTVTHGNIAWYTGMMPGAFDRRASDRFAVTTPFTFATSVRQTFVPLTLGAHTSVATAAQASDARELLGFLKRERITAWEVVPSMLRACVDLLRLMPESDRRSLLDNSLRQVGCIGEPLPAAAVREWLELGGRGQFTNSYGQSEASGLAVWPIDDATIQAGGVVPAGRPTPGNAIRIVNAENRPVTDGETGEIVVEGPAVAFGYRGSRDGDRFSVTPAGARAFRTGDLGRWRTDGALEVLGRLDDQLKVRGVRVDPIEVEAVLRSHDAVRSAAVAVHQRSGEGVLVAYLCCVHEPPSAAEFRTLLRTRLTGPMVPSVFVRVAELPYTATGKLDRRALPNPFISAGNASSAAGIATRPAATIAECIAEVWKAVLGVAEVEPHDDFFELGGSSLSGAQVVERLEHDFGVRLSLTTLLNHPTLSVLASTLQATNSDQSALKVVSLRSGGLQPAILCIPGLRGRAAGMFALSQHLGRGHAVYAIDAEHADLGGVSVQEIAKRFASLALAQHPGPYCVLGFSFAGVLAFETARALGAAGGEVTRLALLDAVIPRTSAVHGATRILAAAEEYLSVTVLRLKRALPDPMVYVRKLFRPTRLQESRRAVQNALGDYSATPLDVPTLFILARSLPLVRGRMRVWQALTGDFRAHSIQAEHNGLITEPTVAEVAAIIEADLADAVATKSVP